MSAPRSQALWRIQIRRPHRIGPYFANSCCVAQHLIIELDGCQHAEPEEERKDGLRKAYLNQKGYRVLRFWNEQINNELEGVLQAVYTALTNPNRAPRRRADKGPSLGAQKPGAVLPLSREENYGRNFTDQ